MAQRVYTVTCFDDIDWSTWVDTKVFGNIEDAARFAHCYETHLLDLYYGTNTSSEVEKESVAIAIDTDGYLGGMFFAMEPKDIC